MGRFMAKRTCVPGLCSQQNHASEPIFSSSRDAGSGVREIPDVSNYIAHSCLEIFLSVCLNNNDDGTGSPSNKIMWILCSSFSNNRYKYLDGRVRVYVNRSQR